jgi:hypothetical protein
MSVDTRRARELALAHESSVYPNDREIGDLLRALADGVERLEAGQSEDAEKLAKHIAGMVSDWAREKREVWIPLLEAAEKAERVCPDWSVIRELKERIRAAREAVKP